MRVIKRNGAEVEFDIVKIIAAVTKANDVVDEEARMTPVQIQRIAESVEFSCQSLGRAPTVEEIQDFVEHQIMAHGAFEVAKRYITYRYNRSLVRKSNTTDDKILSLIECNNEEAKQENSNKNPVVNSTQRDYMAGEVSRDLTNRLLLPEDIVKAHEEGIIHFHDTDYYAQHMHNCDLVNLEDMLQNGTVITGTLIERPHSFATACNIATQIVAQVASNQYGGQSISLTHLAPFVDVSRQKIRKQVLAEVEALGGIYSGLLTATESSAIAVVWSFIAGMFIYRELKWSDLFDIFVDSAKSSAMTLFIIATSTAFAWLFAYAGISTQLVDFVVGMHLSATMYCLVVAVILLIFGTFLEGIATAVLLVPVLWPVAQALGVNVIHFGMIVSIANVVGTMTPPVAVNIFSAASVTKLSMGKIVHGQWPFFIGYVGFFFLVVFIPALSTFLL